MTVFKKVFLFLFVLLLAVLVWQHQLIRYGLAQLQGQLRIILNTQNGDDFLADPDVPVEWKEKFRLIGEVSQFCTDSLGLKPTKNYTTVYNQHNKPVLWVVTGCLPFEFKAKTWNFPFLGEVTYKGFFNREKAFDEFRSLKQEGYDADLSSTAGWSTLGWFKDPVLSNMLNKSEGTLTELIIHELTHGTIFIKNQIELNENLATFIGEKGAMLFLKTKYGIHSKQLQFYTEYLSDESLYGEFLIHGRVRLDSLYRTFSTDLQDVQKEKLKKAMIRKLISEIDSLPLIRKERYRFETGRDSLPNNTFFMSNERYRNRQDLLDEILQSRSNGNLKNFIRLVKETKPETLIQLFTITK